MQLLKFLVEVSKELVVLDRWKSETGKFRTKSVVKGQIYTTAKS